MSASIGIILCADKDNIVVEYALRSVKKPAGAAEYYLTKKLVIVQLLEINTCLSFRLCHNYEKCQFCHSEGAKRLKNLDDK